MQLQLMTWPDVQAYLGRRTDIIVPIGSTEQHGPTGLVGTDALTAEAVARGLGEKVGAVVGPTLAVGMAHHHLAFSGTLTLRPTTLIAVVRDVVASCKRHGFRQVLFVNGHGGNIATVNVAFQEIYAEASLAGEGADVRCALVNWWDGSRVPALCREFYAGQDGSHATASEIAVTWALFPETAREGTAHEPPVAPSGKGWTDAGDYRRHYPDGRIGSNPGLSTIEQGQRLLAAAVEDMAEKHAAFLKAGE